MNSSFIIQPSEINTHTANLYIEISSHGLSYIILDNKSFVALATYNFKEGTTDEIAAGFIHELMADQPALKEKFGQVAIIYGYPQSVLVPKEFMSEVESKAMLDLVFGDVRDSIIRNELMRGHLIYNVYSVPALVDSILSHYFPTATFHHLFSLLPNAIKVAGSHLYCIFHTGYLTVMLHKEEKLQVIQTFTYQAPDDVSYHLLNICNSFGAGIQEVSVHLSGVIDVNSTLYSEIYKYFSKAYFDGLPNEYKYTDEIKSYPAHYFSHLFGVASCV